MIGSANEEVPGPVQYHAMTLRQSTGFEYHWILAVVIDLNSMKQVPLTKMMLYSSFSVASTTSALIF